MKIEHYELYGKDLSIPRPENYGDCMKLIKSDRYRITGRMDSSLKIIAHALRPFSNSRILFWLRMSSYRGIFYPLCRVFYAWASRRAQVQIAPSTRIGYGFYIGHNICMVINGGTIIGNNVNISQFLNIGTNKNTPAIIGDNVYIGPQVSIVEDVRIGNDATIGAGAVVTRDIPEGATAAGVPARVLNHNTPGRFVHKRYPL